MLHVVCFISDTVSSFRLHMLYIMICNMLFNTIFTSSGAHRTVEKQLGFGIRHQTLVADIYIPSNVLFPKTCVFCTAAIV